MWNHQKPIFFSSSYLFINSTKPFLHGMRHTIYKYTCYENINKTIQNMARSATSKPLTNYQWPFENMKRRKRRQKHTQFQSLITSNINAKIWNDIRNSNANIKLWTPRLGSITMGWATKAATNKKRINKITEMKRHTK